MSDEDAPIDVLDHGSATVFHQRDSASRWLQVENRLVVNLERAR